MAAAIEVERSRYRLTPRAVDALLAATLGLLAQAEVWLTEAAAGRQAETAVTAAAMCAALAWRRSSSLASTLAIVAAVAVLGLLGDLPNAVFLLPVTVLALYSLASHDTAERAAVGLAAAIAVLGVMTARDADATITDLTAPALIFSGAWAVGRVSRSRGIQAALAERRAARLAEEQVARERAAVAAERARIARELHDIVAHRVTTMVIQSDSGQATAEEAERSRDAFAAIGESGRQALVELRRLLGVLRAEDDEGVGVEPQPGLGRVALLISEMKAAGLHVDATITEPAQPMSAGVELAAYRLVQEALTNALRHGDGRVRLRIEPAPGALVIRTSNRSATGAPVVAGSGHGLAGMRERVRLFGGELEAGWHGEHFELTARLPLEPVGA